MVAVLPKETGALTPFSVEDGLARVEQRLAQQVACDEPLLARMARAVVFAGGKRLRPRVAVLSYAACGGDGRHLDQLVDAAAGMELVHTASLVHDDIIDASPLRRGQPTLHTSHGLGHAIVAGDFLFTQGFALAGRLTQSVVHITAEACVKLAEGEVLEQRLAGNPGLSVEQYLDVIARKTAEPLRACARVGASLAGAPRDVEDEMGRYGLELGLAFQIADDLLDLAGDPTQTGKPVGLDAHAGVLTLPALLALKPDERAAYLRDPDALRATLVASGAVEAARAYAHRYVTSARERLKVLPESPHREALDRLAAGIVDRKA